MINAINTSELRFRWLTLSMLFTMVASLYFLASFHPAISQDEVLPMENRVRTPSPEMHAKTTDGTSIQNLPHLQNVLAAHNYNIKPATGNYIAVPRLYCENFPQDLKKIRNFEHKKDLFLKVLLPMVLAVNENIIKDRIKLLKLRDSVDKGLELTAEDREWLADLSEVYKMKTIDIAELVRRVDIIPPSMALAQAAVETGWGVSHAALKKNSLFGMMKTFDQVKFYDTLYQSTISYIRNLNTNDAYREMRKTRQQIRQKGKKPDGHTLIGDLVRYSVQRNLYISKVRSAIKKNNLAQFDQAQLQFDFAHKPKVKDAA